MLAAQLLPPMELPPNWATEHHLILRPILAEATTGKGRNFEPTYEYPTGWPTPFEVVAEEATRRARILFDAAAGRIRQERTAYYRSGKEADQQMKDYAEATAFKEGEFERHANGKSFLLIMEALQSILPKVYKHKPENAYRYWREYLRTSTETYRNKHGLPELPVKFRDELSDEEESFAVDPDSSGARPHVVTLDHDSSYHVNRSEYGRLAIHLRQFYDSSGGARVKRTIAAEAGRKGGKKSQENIRKDGKISPEDGRKLTIAAEKAQKKSIIA